MSERTVPNAPFTAATAARSGWTPSAQRHAVDSGQWGRLQLGVFEQSSTPEPARHLRLRNENLAVARGAARACDRAALSHSSATIAWGLPVVGRAVGQPCLTVQSGTALRKLAKVHLHRATLDEVAVIDEFAVTPVARTVVDLAREHGVITGVAARMPRCTVA